MSWTVAELRKALRGLDPETIISLDGCGCCTGWKQYGLTPWDYKGKTQYILRTEPTPPAHGGQG